MQMQNQVTEQAAMQWAGLQLSLFGPRPEEVEAEQAHEMVQQALAYFDSTQGAAEHDEAQMLLLAPNPQHDLPKRSPMSPDDGEAQLELDDESCEFFRQVGCRMLLIEMVVQSVRDLVLVRDEARAARLKAKSEVEWEEVATSAAWLKEPFGRLAVQVLFPDWDHEAIIRRIYEDPQGVLKRFESWGAVSAAAREQGLSTMSLAGHVDWSRLDLDEPSWSG